MSGCDLIKVGDNLYHYDDYSAYRPEPENIVMAFSESEVSAARDLVPVCGASGKIKAIKIIRELTNRSLLEAKKLYELAEKTHVPF